MESLLASAKSFASMHESVDEQFFFQCAREYALSLVSMLIEKYGSDRVGEATLFSAIAESPRVADQMPFWRPELGHCFDALISDKLPVARRGLAQIALNHLSVELPGQWFSDFAEPVHLRWGHVLLPEAVRLEVDCDGTEARVKIRGLDSSHTLHFYGLGNDEFEWRGTGAEVMPSVKFGRRRVLLLSAQHCKDLALPPPPVLPGVPTVTDTHRRNYETLLALFDEHFPSCVSWLERVIRVVTISQKAPIGMHSGTVEDYYGSIWISDTDNLLKIAESLLHEASHNYYYLLTDSVGFASRYVRSGVVILAVRTHDAQL